MEYVISVFAEHTKAVREVRWNVNNQDEFATVSEDMLLKIWDRRMEESVTTLVDREGSSPLRSCDWHKRDVS